MTTQSNPQGQSKKSNNVIKWIVGIVFIFGGIGLFGESVLSGIFVLLAGLVVTPAVSDKLKEMVPIWKNKRYVRITVPILLVLIGASFSDSPQQSGDNIQPQNTTTVVSEADNEVIQEEIPEEAKPSIPYSIEKEEDDYGGIRYYVLMDKVSFSDSMFIDNVKEIIDDVVKQKGARIDIDIFDDQRALETMYGSDNGLKLNKKELDMMKTHHIAWFSGEAEGGAWFNTLCILLYADKSTPIAKKYQKTIEYNPTTRNSEIAQQQRSENQQKQANLKKKQEDFKKKYFSAWDGSNNELVKQVKKNMHNPKSFEHAGTSIALTDNYAVVTMTYRGTNKLGAVVTEKIKAKMDYNGKIIEIMN